MPISETQLETWSHQGATVTAKATADAVKRALNEYDNFPTNNYEVYLQGSYKNDTNIRGESDVDVVVQLNKTFSNNLTQGQKNQLGLEPADYQYTTFYEDVVNALNTYFGSHSVVPENKCIKIKANDNRLPADVIVALQYRRYYAVEKNSYHEGVSFKTQTGRRTIINFPKQVYNNGVIKNRDTNGMFKPMVRIFKNMRRVADLEAPSYFVQCLLYNLPNSKFVTNYFNTCVNILEYIRLISDENLGKFLCQHEKFSLFGSSPEQWDTESARKFNKGLITFWNNWDK